MKAISKTLVMFALALLMPLSAGAAMAAQAPETTAVGSALTSTDKIVSAGLVQKTVQPETIKVAGHHGRGLALGIIAGVATAAIVAGASRRHHRHYDYNYNHTNYSYRHRRRRCERWAYRCDCGDDYACHKYYRYCE